MNRLGIHGRLTRGGVWCQAQRLLAKYNLDQATILREVDSSGSLFLWPLAAVFTC